MTDPLVDKIVAKLYTEEPDPIVLCGFEWTTSWGSHECVRPVEGHHALRHRCACDDEEFIKSDSEIGQNGHLQEEPPVTS